MCETCKTKDVDVTIQENGIIRESNSGIIIGRLDDYDFNSLPNSSWKEIAAQFSRNSDYYAGLLDRIAENFGIEAYTSDDGSVQDSPLRAKMPELVSRLKRGFMDLVAPQKKCFVCSETEMEFIQSSIEQSTHEGVSEVWFTAEKYKCPKCGRIDYKCFTHDGRTAVKITKEIIEQRTK